MEVGFLVDADRKVKVKVERVIGEGSKQKFIEETKIINAVKIVEIVPTITDVKSIVKEGKVIVQGTVHKQIFFVGPDGLEHHEAEDLEWSELIEVEPIDPSRPVTTGMNEQTHPVVENLVWEFDPATGTLIQKIIIGIDVKVTETEQLDVARDPLGPVIKAQVVVGQGEKQKFVREEKTIEAIKIVDIVPSLTSVRSHVKNGKVILQGILHKQIFFVGTDNVVHHVAEDVPWSDLIEVPEAEEGMNEQDESSVENLVWEFDPDTGRLVQKAILRLRVKVTRTEELAVGLDVYGPLIKAERVIGRGTRQKFLEETKTLPAVKIVDIVPALRDVTSVVKDGKAIVQGVLHKQIFFVGTDGLVHHEVEDIDFSEMVEIVPLDPLRQAREGMNQQDHSEIENLVWEFDPDTGVLIQKAILRIDVVVTETEQLRVADP